MQGWGEDRAVRAVVLRYLLVENKWRADAKGVRLRGVRVSGHLDLEAATLRCPLWLENCYLDADEPVSLDTATALSVTLTGCQLAGLTCDTLIARKLDLSRSTFTGPVQLTGADISGDLNCTGVHLNGRDRMGNALVAERFRVAGDVFLREAVTTSGAIRLTGANITGTLSCSGAQLNGCDGEGNALIADELKAGGEVHLHRRFTAAGAVSLAGADITGTFSCDGAHLKGHERFGNALVAFGMTVGGDVRLGDGFIAAGAILLRSARIGGRLLWAPAKQVCAEVNLQGVTASQLRDDWGDGRANGYWPPGGKLRLDGFTYSRFADQKVTVTQRLNWIRSQYHEDKEGEDKEGFATQPYEQLAAVYQQTGQDDQAREAAIARRRDLRKRGNLNWYRRFSNLFLDTTIRYGYHTWRAGIGLAAVFLIFTWLSCLAQQHHLVVPVGSYKGAMPSATKCTRSYPCFYPPGYAIDTVIPIINVHQAANWGPDGSTPYGSAFVAATWIATGLGWALVTLLVAGYTGPGTQGLTDPALRH